MKFEVIIRDVAESRYIVEAEDHQIARMEAEKLFNADGGMMNDYIELVSVPCKDSADAHTDR